MKAYLGRMQMLIYLCMMGETSLSDKIVCEMRRTSSGNINDKRVGHFFPDTRSILILKLNF